MVFALNLQKGIFESNLAMSHICHHIILVNNFNYANNHSLVISLQIGFLVQKHGLIHDAKFST